MNNNDPRGNDDNEREKERTRTGIAGINRKLLMPVKIEYGNKSLDCLQRCVDRQIEQVYTFDTMPPDLMLFRKSFWTSAARKNDK